jgi:Domain of unknown function (DUF5916)/Carbohydrate family 9 binding domain-like
VKKFFYISIFTLAFHALFYAQNNAPATTPPPIEKKKYTTKKRTEAIKLDGLLDEAAWDAVDWGGDFIQFEPNEGKAPSVQTQFKILFDDKFLYLAYRCFDPHPDSIVKRMGRRDEFPGDLLEINLDTYHDLRTAFSFTLSVSGVRSDEFCSSNGSNWDASWNPIWFAKTNIDDKGWTAEVKIPLSQLRFGNETDKVWGLQLIRRLFRKEERSVWQLVPQSSGVWVSGFGELHGLHGIPSQKQVEIAPYIIAQTSKFKKEEGNPFATGSASKISGGMDGKVAVTSDLILDFTVNPDFGQVEADPSQVRIDGFQSFFEEKRPFFIESRNIFDYQLTGSEAGGEYDSDLLFYSRRIGSSPHGSPSLDSGEHADVPQNTSILGAAKFSGKTKDGLSIGILESITQREKATIDRFGKRRDELVEPLTSYFVGRLQKDRDSGNTVLGGIFTGVNRETGLDYKLHKSAYSGGFDFLHFWKNKTWVVRGNVVFSHVQGSKEAIFNTQTSFEHLFQRPNATEFRLDNTRTSLTGTGGTIRFGKIAGNRSASGRVFKFETGATFRSPELELNDIGFMLTADEINHFTWVSLQWQKPVSVFRRARVNYNHWLRWDFGGKFLYDAFNVNGHANFKNNWETGTGFTINPYEMSNNALRGGSAMLRPPGMGQFGYLRSDSRKKVMASLNFFYARGFSNTVKFNNINLDVRVQPINALNFSISAGYDNMWRKQDQYVTETNFKSSSRTIVSEVTQNTLNFRARLNYNITPDLTLQYYAQPFVTRPLYKNFAYITEPLNPTYENRFRPYAANEIREENGYYLVDENHDGAADYSFRKPDFNFVQFRSNLVLRWEYLAGSEIFLVWSQGATPDVAGDINTPLSKSLFDNAFGQESRNIWLVKMTYRFLK